MHSNTIEHKKIQYCNIHSVTKMIVNNIEFNLFEQIHFRKY